MLETEPITLTHEIKPFTSSMVINPHGARIEGLTLDERLVFTSITRGDGKSASSHPCTPNFGPETTTSYGLCEVEGKDPNRVVLNYYIQAGEYPQGMRVTQAFSLRSRNFTLVTTHENKGDQPAPVNFGEHFYWAAPQGWEGLTINGRDVTDAVKNDLVIPLKARNQILIPGLSEITLDQRGLPYGNLWVYHDEGRKYDQDYVCIEPVEGDPTQNYFGSPESLIPPGLSRNTVIIISTTL